MCMGKAFFIIRGAAEGKTFTADMSVKPPYPPWPMSKIYPKNVIFF